jgi:oligopeptide transport system substrate-binding protein
MAEFSEQMPVWSSEDEAAFRARPRTLSRREVLGRALAISGAAALAGVPRFAFAQSSTPAVGANTAAENVELADSQVMRLPTKEPANMDPGVSFGDDGELNVLFNIFDGLVGVDQATGKVVPRVAESFEPNADATEFIFKLRTGLKWSDGTPMDANDFVYSWQRVLDPATRSQYIPALYPIKNAEAIANGKAKIDTLGVQAVDANTLKVTLEGPTTYFPLLASTWTFYPVPKHVIDKVKDKWVEAANIVSNGPFIMKEWKHDDSITLVQNPTYYGDKPTLTQATYQLFKDPSTQAYTAFENNELDYAEPEGPDLDRVLADPELKKDILTFQLSNCYFVVCDCTNAPTDKVEFRQALYMAVDRATLANSVLKQQWEAAFTVLPNDIAGHNQEAAMKEDVAKAKELLKTAGITDPGSVKLDLVFISDTARYKTVAEYLQANWQKNLGIKINLSPIENSQYSDWRASREKQPFNLYTGTWGSDFSDPSNWFNQNFTNASDHYRNHWNDPEFDQLVDKAATNTNEQERVQQYQQAEKIIVEQAPIIPLYRGKAFRAVKPWVKDLYFQPVLSYVHLRTIKIAKH